MVDQSALGLETLDENTLKAPKTVIKNPSSGRKVFNELQQRNRNRVWLLSKHQELLDGAPPFDQQVLFANGQGGRTNVDFGDAKAAHQSMMTGAIDMMTSVERLARVPLKRSVIPDDEQRESLVNTLSDELSRAIRNWENWNELYQRTAHFCFGHGAAVVLFEDQVNWQPQVTWLADFTVPEGSRTSESKIPVAAFREDKEVYELYRYIQDEAAAEAMGWNVEEVKKAILKATPDSSNEGYSMSRWNKVVEELRNNSVGSSAGGKTAKVKVFHLWAQEYDGTVSKYISTIQPSFEGVEENEPWMYQKQGAFDEMRRCFIFFTNGIGTNGTIHSCSGLLRDIYPQCQALNRSMCTMIDSSVLSCGIPIQPTSDGAIPRMKIGNLGGLMPILPSAEHGIVVTRPFPNPSQSMMPIISDFRGTIGNRTGQFQGQPPFQGSSVERTRTEVLATMEQLSKVGATQTNLWYPPYQRLLREIIRRMCDPAYFGSYNIPGGAEVAQLHRRLEERGFPLELLEAIEFDDITAERAIGAGSGSARAGKLVQLNEIAGDFDDIGKYNLVRDMTAAILDGDYTLADRYKPARPDSRPPIDTQFAILENALMKQGIEPTIQTNQLHLPHIREHATYLGELVQSVESGQEEMDNVVEQMVMAHTHGTDHLELAQTSRLDEQEVAQYRQLFQQLGEIVNQALQKYMAKRQKELAEQQDAQAAGGEGQPGMPEESPQLQEKLIASRLKLQSMNEVQKMKEAHEERMNQQRMMHKQQMFQQDMAHKDMRTAADIIADQKKLAAQLRAKANLPRPGANPGKKK